MAGTRPFSGGGLLSRPGQFAALACNNCSERISLPTAAKPCIAEGLGSWPEDCAPRSFLCPKCNHAYVYLVQHVHPFPFDETAHPSCKVQKTVNISFRCEEKSCAAVIQIYTLSALDEASSEDLLGEVRKLLAQSTAHGIPCGRGHFLNGPMRDPGISAVASFDEAW